MAEKALCIKMYNVTFDNNEYELTAEATATDGEGGSRNNFTVSVHSTTFQPISPTWKELVGAAILSHVETQWPDQAADQVLFQDGSVYAPLI